MRSLTFDEMNYVSGGGNAPADDMIIVTDLQYPQYGITSGSASGDLFGFSNFIFDLNKLLGLNKPSLPEGPVNPIPPTVTKNIGDVNITDNVHLHGVIVKAPEGSYYGGGVSLNFE
jgi:hypothetical protein